MNTLHTTGRWLFAVPFFLFGLMHLMNAGQFASLVPSYFPGNGSIWVVLTGIVFIVASAGVALHKYEKEAALLLAAQVSVLILLVWLPQILGGNQMAIGNLLKDLALVGAALAFAGLATKSHSNPSNSAPTAPSM